MFRLDQFQDLPRILEIYNQVIDKRTVTADITPATIESRQAWFNLHLSSKKYPLWVARI